MNKTTTDVHDSVRAGYAEIAQTGRWSGVTVGATSGGTAEDLADPTQSQAGSCCGGGGCCGPTTMTAADVAQAVGYAQADLETLPEGANLGLSCGNPNALAALKPGEVVVDLGSGGGLDCLIAGPKVGAGGAVIGVDMTPQMLSNARRALPAYHERTGLDNVSFRLGEIEHLPIADGSVDVVLSNCVLNLSPDKPQVWREIARVLKPGGRVAISDLALRKPLPDAIKGDIEALVGCIAGAVTIDENTAYALQAGLVDIKLDAKTGYVEAMVSNDDPLYVRMLGHLPAGETIADYVVSLDITAVKPSS